MVTDQTITKQAVEVLYYYYIKIKSNKKINPTTLFVFKSNQNSLLLKKTSQKSYRNEFMVKHSFVRESKEANL